MNQSKQSYQEKANKFIVFFNPKEIIPIEHDRLSPDTIDDFISWLHHRFDLDSFRRSKSEFKMLQFHKFCSEQLDKQHNQLKMNFK